MSPQLEALSVTAALHVRHASVHVARKILAPGVPRSCRLAG